MTKQQKIYFGLISALAFLGALKIINNEFEIRNLNKVIEQSKTKQQDLTNQMEELKLSCSTLENYNKMEEITKKKIHKQ
jgi:cell division protein FtsL